MNLKDLHKMVAKCEKCPLHKGRTNAVPGEGAEDADIMFIGEGPGRDEDLQGRPFVGAAGKFLTAMIESIGLRREDVYIANVVKCRPPNNRDPEQKEIDTCWSYLEEQIRMIKPKIIVTLGRHSMGRFMPGLKISQVHGQPKRASGIWQDRQVYLPLYHPAAALYDPRQKDVHMKDFKKIPLILKKIKSENDS
ncbi:MAG: uracil-DNA glycosylase [Nitrospirota bacterium]